ncbi:MAG: conjugative transposon protein TraM [Cyclobacteriaceae bacterium]
MTNDFSPQLTRERNAVFLLPLIIIPLLVYAFHVLGGGKSPEPRQTSGLMMTLPEPILEGGFKDKLTLYEEADKDSVERAEAIRKDPYARLMQKEGLEAIDFTTGEYHVEDPLFPQESKKGLKEAEEQMESQLEKLHELMSSPKPDKGLRFSYEEEPAAERRVTTPITPKRRPRAIDPQVDRLEGLMASMQQPAGEDPELKQIEAMLNKILDVQHPERVKQRLAVNEKEEGYAPSYFTLETTNEGKPQKTSERKTYEATTISHVQNGFYGLEDNPSSTEMPDYTENVQTGIRASVTHTQKVRPGSTLEMKLDDTAYLSGKSLAKGTTLYGTCSYRGDRLIIDIGSIRLDKGLYPIRLTAYGMDGQPGIHVPGSILSDVASEQVGRSLQSLNMSDIGGNTEIMAANAGLNMASKLLNKRKKQPAITVIAGHPILLISL